MLTCPGTIRRGESQPCLTVSFDGLHHAELPLAHAEVPEPIGSADRTSRRRLYDTAE